jgi:hypothetical protein
MKYCTAPCRPAEGPWVPPETQLLCLVKQVQNSINVPYLPLVDTARLAVLQHLAPHFSLQEVDGKAERVATAAYACKATHPRVCWVSHPVLFFS